MSGPSSPGPACAHRTSSLVNRCTSGRPWEGRSFQPCAPSKARTVRSLMALTSKRILLGRFCDSMNSRLGTLACTLSMCPAQTIVCTLRQASSPPRAATFFTTICSAESFGGVAFGLASASEARPAASAAASRPQRRSPFGTERRGGMRNSRWRGSLRLRLHEQGVGEFRIHCHLVDDHLVRVPIPIDRRFEHKGDHDSLYGTEIALVDPHGVHASIHAVRRAFDLDIEKALRVDPDVLHITIF